MTTYSVTSWEVLCRGHARSFLFASLAWLRRRGAAHREKRRDARKVGICVQGQSCFCRVFYHAAHRRATVPPRRRSLPKLLPRYRGCYIQTAFGLTKNRYINDGGWRLPAQPRPCFPSRNKKKSVTSSEDNAKSVTQIAGNTFEVLGREPILKKP